MKQLWPNVNEYAKDLIKNVIEPQIVLAMEPYKMYGFRFERVILGTIVSIMFLRSIINKNQLSIRSRLVQQQYTKC